MAVTASTRAQTPAGGPAARPVAPRARRTFSPRRTAASVWRPLILVIALVAGWWAVTEAQLVAPYILPSPADTWNAAADNVGYLAQHTWVTTWETVAGFVIAAVLGVFMAVVMVYSTSLEKTVYPSSSSPR